MKPNKYGVSVAEARGGRTHSTPQTIDTKAYHEAVDTPQTAQSPGSVTNCDNLWVTEDGLIMDLSDWWAYSRHRWTIQKGYARGYVNGKNRYFHRHIMAATPGQVVDHINGNPLDCRRCNLRVTDKFGNAQNKSIAAKKRDGYKGVDRRPGGKWRAKIGTAGKVIHLGSFDTPEQAARAYDEAAIKIFGHMAKVNLQAGASCLQTSDECRTPHPCEAQGGAA